MRRAAFLIVVDGRARAAGSRLGRPVPADGGASVPVILVHGTFANQALSWNALRPLLEADGFCVFSLDYGTNATGPMAKSGDTVRRLRAAGSGPDRRAPRCPSSATPRAARCSRYVAKAKGLLAQTDDIVGLAPSSHGTTTPFAGAGGAPRLRRVRRPGRRLPVHAGAQRAARGAGPVSYTVVSTRYDEVVTPYQSQALAGDTVTQRRRCRIAARATTPSTSAIIYDPVALQWARDALLRPGPANPAFVPDCSGATTGTDPSLPGAARNAAIAPHLELRGTSVRLGPDGRIAVPVRCVAPAGKTCRGLLAVRAGGRLAAVRPFSVPGGPRRAPGAAPRPARPPGELRQHQRAARARARLRPARLLARQECGFPHPDARSTRATLDGGLPLSSFTPAVRDWFERSFEAPTPAQEQAWPAIATGEHVLISAPTGQRQDAGGLPVGTRPPGARAGRRTRGWSTSRR